MKGLILISLLISSGVQAACMPDSLLIENDADFNLQGLEQTVSSFQEVIQQDIPRGENLIINADTLNPRVNAEIVRLDNNVVINLFGGMLKHPKLTPHALSLLLCHEIGHFLGGPPFKSRNGWSSTEGQADYYSSVDCIKKLHLDEGEFFDAAISLTSIYAQVGREPAPRFDQCDSVNVARTNYGYPSVQCRLDTLIAGWTNKTRPKCWFFE